MADLFKEVLPSLNLKTEHLIDDLKMEEKEFNAYMVNKAFSYGVDTILYANEMNKLYDLPLKMQYDFYFYGLDKRKRYNPWAKKETLNNIDTIKEYYGCGTKKAEQYAKVLTPEQIELIEQRTGKGSISKSK